MLKLYTCLILLLVVGCTGAQGPTGNTGATGDASPPCTVLDTDLGATITCPDGTSAVVANGVDSAPGSCLISQPLQGGVAPYTNYITSLPYELDYALGIHPSYLLGAYVKFGSSPGSDIWSPIEGPGLTWAYMESTGVLHIYLSSSTLLNGAHIMLVYFDDTAC